VGRPERRFADAFGTDVDVDPVHASARELAAVGRSDGEGRDGDGDGAVDAGTAGDAGADGDRGDGEPELAPGDFPLYTPEPYVADTTRLAALGWDSTPLDTTCGRTVADHRESDRDGGDRGPDPRLVDAFLGGV
jgi:hypothetical protein